MAAYVQTEDDKWCFSAAEFDTFSIKLRLS